MPPSPPDPVLALCERLWDGSLTPEEKAELERLVLGDPQARRRYVELMHLHAGLRWQLGSPPPAPPIAEAAVPRRRLRGLAYALSLPAMLALGLLAARLFTSPPPAVATLVATQTARWEGGTLPTVAGARLPPGRLTLAQGLVRLTFDEGAEVALEGPAILEVVSARECRLHRGSLVARVPPRAAGFTVRSATAVVVDHGTEFAVAASTESETRVEVLSGLVEARHPHTARNLRLSTAEVVVFGQNDVRPAGHARGEPRTSVVAQAGPGDLVISTGDGAGRASFVHSPPETTDARPADLVLVKNTDDPAWQRKGYLIFDLAALGKRTIAGATLTLTLVPTGLGHAAFVPDATFAVYGVLEGHDRREELTWQTAPGNAPGGAGVAADQVRLLGTFVVPQGASEGSFTIGGDELARFLGRDSDGRATLLLVRLTPETRGGGLVHGFAGDHHPTGAPPTLRLFLR